LLLEPFAVFATSAYGISRYIAQIAIGRYN
jgi:hypothetical protein